MFKFFSTGTRVPFYDGSDYPSGMDTMPAIVFSTDSNCIRKPLFTGRPSMAEQLRQQFKKRRDSRYADII